MSTRLPSPNLSDGPTGRRLGLLRVALDQGLAAILAEVAPRHPELRPAHLLIFRLGGIDGSRAAELAEHAGMTKQSMHELMTHLERHGYLERHPDPVDTRARLVRLTKDGRKLEQQIHRAIAGVLESWRDRVGSERFDALWATLQDITGESGPLPDLADLRSGQGTAGSRSRRP